MSRFLIEAERLFLLNYTQALLPDSGMMDDFAFQESKRIVNVVNAPSPAATSSISVGQTIVGKLAAHFE